MKKKIVRAEIKSISKSYQLGFAVMVAEFQVGDEVWKQNFRLSNDPDHKITREEIQLELNKYLAKKLKLDDNLVEADKLVGNPIDLTIKL